MSGHFFSTKAMLAGVIPPLLHTERRRQPTSDANLHLPVENDSTTHLSLPIEAPAMAPRVRLVDFLRKDMQQVHLPPGVPTIPAFAALKVEEDKAESEYGEADVPHFAPL